MRFPEGKPEMRRFLGTLLNVHELRGPTFVSLAIPNLLFRDGLDCFYTNTVILGKDAVKGRLMTALHVPIVDTSDVGSNDYLDLYSSFTLDHRNRTARNTISTQSIGFHMVTSMHCFAAILYNACPHGTVLGNVQESTVPAVYATATQPTP
jgi:hypothetical protein